MSGPTRRPPCSRATCTDSPGPHEFLTSRVFHVEHEEAQPDPHVGGPTSPPMADLHQHNPMRRRNLHTWVRSCRSSDGTFHMEHPTDALRGAAPRNRPLVDPRTRPRRDPLPTAFAARRSITRPTHPSNAPLHRCLHPNRRPSAPRNRPHAPDPRRTPDEREEMTRRRQGASGCSPEGRSDRRPRRCKADPLDSVPVTEQASPGRTTPPSAPANPGLARVRTHERADERPDHPCARDVVALPEAPRLVADTAAAPAGGRPSASRRAPRARAPSAPEPEILRPQRRRARRRIRVGPRHAPLVSGRETARLHDIAHLSGTPFEQAIEAASADRLPQPQRRAWLHLGGVIGAP
jgi:hypothetical protein